MGMEDASLSKGGNVKAAHEPQRVSAADFIRGFANWRLQSTRKPVVVTHHGKDAHVLISLDDFRRLDDKGASEIAAASNALRDSFATLVESIRDAIIVIDHQWRIAALNPAASDMLGIAAAQSIGEPLAALLPRLDGSLLAHRLNRLLDHRERFAGEIPGVVRPRQWLRVDLIPVALGGAIVLRDVSDTMDDCAASDTRQALIAAVEADTTIGHARISVREAIETANAALTAMIGVDAAAIRRVRFSALLAIGERQAFAEALESVFLTGTAVRIGSQMVTREGAALAVTLSIAEVRGVYASDGAVIVVTPRVAA